MTGGGVNILFSLIIGGCAFLATALLCRWGHRRTHPVLAAIEPRWRAAIVLGFLLSPWLAGSIAAIVHAISGFDHGPDLIAHHCHAAAASRSCSPHDTPLTGSGAGLVLSFLFAGLTVSSGLATLRPLGKWNHHKTLLRAVCRYSRTYCAHIIDDARPFAFCAGILKPMIVLSTGLLRRLSAPEIAIVLAHERAHARRHDNLLQLLAACAAFGHLPSTGRRLRDDLLLASEQACDVEAARITTGRLAVAETIMKVERLYHPSRGGGSVGIAALTGSFVPDRVRFLLDEPAALSRRATFRLTGAVAGAALGMMLSLEPTHHLVETAIFALVS